MLGERDGNNALLAEGNKDDDNKYGKDGNIPNNEDKYAIGLKVSASPLTRVTTSAAPARACPASQRPSMPSR